MTNRKHLLVVDDEEMNRDMLSRRLERAGYTVEVAADAGQALARLQRDDIELILLDSMMPGMSGVDLLRLLRGTYSQSELPIIMVTALSDSSKVVEALNLGANDYITKPIDFSIALARIQSQITRKQAEQTLRQNEERYALAARGAGDGLWDWDLSSNKLHLSESWCDLMGYRASEVSDNPEQWIERLHKEDVSGFRSALESWRRPAGGDRFSTEHRMRHKDGTYRWLLARGVVVRDSQGNAMRMAGSHTDLTNSRAYDELTGLPNRALFHERLASAIEAQAAGRSGYSVLCLDVDRFKVINDSMGHQAGDRLLRRLAERLRDALAAESTASQNHMLARLGGDEFAILLDGIDSVFDVERIAQAVEAASTDAYSVQPREVFASVSLGIVIGSEEYQTPEEILRDADTAMNRAKSLGRARWAIFDNEMRATAVARMELENDLRHAVERGEFVLHYQPKVELATHRVVGFEALIRWQHPTRGMIYPLQFIPIAEETGLIVPIGSWVLREACLRLCEWQRQFPLVPPLEVSVNLSVRQFWQSNLVEEVAAILKETGINPNSIQLEVTESVFVQEPIAAASTLDKLKALGVGLKLDDFGTGYSSLSYLSQLPCDSLKIDKSFVHQMTTDQSCSEIVRTVVALATSLGKQVVAEGIETTHQEHLLKSIGCEFGQGYLFSKPMAVDQATAYLHDFCRSLV